MNLVEFSYRSQIYYLRKVALQALSLYQIPYEQVKLVVHGENTTFKVISKNRKYALRIHRLDYHCYEGIAAELEWLKELKSCSYLQVPVPIQSHDGKYIQTVRIQELKNPRYVILFPWLPGRFCEKSLNTKKMKQVGISTAKLQLSGKKIPLSIAQNRLHWNYEGLLGKNAITSRDYLKHTTKQQAMIIQKFADQIKKQLQCLQTDSNHFGLIHADLHRGNFLFHKDNIAIIDFDDSGLGYYMYDLAVTMASMKNLEKRNAFYDALLEGYNEVISISPYQLELIELFFVVRHLTVLGWICQRTDLPFFQNIIPDRINTTIELCQKYIQNQRFMYC